MIEIVAAMQGVEAPSAGSIVVRVCYYAGVSLLLGGAITIRFAFPAPPRRLLRALTLAWTLTAVSALGLAEQSRHALRLGLVPFLGTHLGHAALVRVLPLLLAHEGLLAATVGRARMRERALEVVAAAAATSALGHVLTSHASSGAWSPAKVALQWIHVVAVAAWIGGLTALLAGLPGTTGTDRLHAARRFSLIAAIGIVAVAGTGGVRALNETGGVRALVTTTYGRLLIAKTDVLLGLAILGALNRYRHVPSVSTTLTRFRRTGAAELGVALVALSLSGVLSGTAPAREAVAPAPPRQVSILQQGSDRAYDIRFSDMRSILVSFDVSAREPVTAHVTFMDARGEEQPTIGAAVVAARGARRVVARVDRLSPGHFMAMLDLTRGTWIISIESHQTAGLRARLRLTV